MINLGEKLKEFRIRKGYTQENVAEMLNMSLTNYANIEQGKTKVNIDKLAKIAEKLETNIFELLTLGEKAVYYIHNDKQQGGEFKNENGYIIHNSLPQEYQLLAQENAFLKEKIQLLEGKNQQNVSIEPFFWQIVELAGENYEQAIEILAQKSLSFLFDFEEILAQKLYALDRHSFAKQIYGNRNVSKDDFLYVRCFAVSQGRTYYEKVLKNEIPMLNRTFEPLLSLAEKAYFRKTSQEFPAIRTSVSYETGSNQAYWS